MISRIFNFIITIFILGFIGPLYGFFKLTNYTKKEIVYTWVNTIKKFLQFKIYRITEKNISHKPNVIYFSNHVTWADFFIDHIITNFSSKFLSRYLVALVFPLFYFLGTITNTILFFNRGANIDFNQFYRWLSYELGSDQYNNLLVYPEGTRRPGATTTSPLKKGIIFYSYEYNHPIQIIHTLNKDILLNEKSWSANKHVVLFVYYSKLIDPYHFKRTNKSREEYYEFVQNYWNVVWNNVHTNRLVKKYMKKPKKYANILDSFSKVNMEISNNNNTLSYWVLAARFGILLSVILFAIYYAYSLFF
jgi:hypothetical protein